MNQEDVALPVAEAVGFDQAIVTTSGTGSVTGSTTSVRSIFPISTSVPLSLASS